MTSTESIRDIESSEAIRHHYDVGNDFYRLWLDESLTYSCALRLTPEDTLETAQQHKLRYHLDAIGADKADRVLDIGCGWGSTLRLLSTAHEVRESVGLTLSEAQAAHIQGMGLSGVDVRIENWTRYEPESRFDGIISIGAFEHFARPDETPAEKIAQYRDFFTRCRDWLNDSGALSLQTIAYANMSREHASTFIQESIFPDADLPTLAEIAAAADGIFEVRSVVNGRLDYAWTCEQWAQRLRQRRDEAASLVGPEITARYERYLKQSAMGFRMGKICLLRLVLCPYPASLFAGGAR